MTDTDIKIRAMDRPTRVRRSRIRRIGGLLGLAIALVGCADDTPAAPQAVVVDALDIAFGQERYDLTAGSQEIELVQQGVLPHSLLIEDESGTDLDIRLLVTGSQLEDRLTVDLGPGTYVFYCDIPGHRQAGMIADVVVSESP